MMMSDYKTLGLALELGAHGIELYCGNCVRQTNFDEHKTRAIWRDLSITFPQIAAKTRCEKCGKPASYAGPRWKFYARGGGEPRQVVPKDWGR